MAGKVEDKTKLLEEKLREGCCMGDEQKVKALLDNGIDVNAANRMNGWTPLHWAAKRGHKKIVELLLKEGALTSSKTKKGETAAALASNQEIKELIGPTDSEEAAAIESLPIVPNYIKNPPFLYLDSDHDGDACMSENDESLPFGLGRNLREDQDTSSPCKRSASKSPLMATITSPPRKTVALAVNSTQSNASLYGKANVSEENGINVLPELVLKVRVANSEEEDFIEIELDFDKLSYENLCEVCCRELKIERTSIKKIRKLPNTIVRKDKDVGRFQQYQELEIVQCSKEDANR